MYVMEDNKNIPGDQLQDLIHILKERIQVYTNAVSAVEAKNDVDLIAFLEKCMQLSQQLKSELLAILPKEGISSSESQWTAGILYNKWKKWDFCLEVSGREQVVEMCTKMEEVIQDIFKQILSSKNHLSENTTAILKSQAALQRELYELIKGFEKGSNTR